MTVTLKRHNQHRSAEQSAELVLAILQAPPEETNDQVADRLNSSREWVRRVRTGASCGELYPELPRRGNTRRHLCNCCEHWIVREFRHGENRRRGLCGLGIPEAIEVGPRWGIGCGAFTQQRQEVQA